MAWFKVIWLSKNETQFRGAAIVKARSKKEALEKAYDVETPHNTEGAFACIEISAKLAYDIMNGLNI